MSVALIAAMLLVVGARYGRAAWVVAVERVLKSGNAVLGVGALTAIAIWFVWGSMNPEPLVTDEASYLFQAKLFAKGRWSAPTPPHPEFFEQSHVLLTPRYASKYPPGHALLLTPGVALGFTPLVPLLLSGLAGALIFLLARLVMNPWVAVLSWLLWLSSPANLRFRPTFFSEVTTSTLWLAGWYVLLRWHATRRNSWLIWLAAFAGFGAITRPLTMLAFAFPVGVFLLWEISRSRTWRIVVVPLTVVAGILSILPLWSARVTGDWRQTPLAVYTRTYMPWDVPGFGLKDEPAERRLPADMEAEFGDFIELHRQHSLANLPRVALERVVTLGHHLAGGWRSWLLPAAVVGLAFLGARGWFALTCGVALFIAYLFYAHKPSWTLYYAEAFPLLAFCMALGLWKIACFLSTHVRSQSKGTPTTGAAAGSLLVILFISVFSLADLTLNRTWRQLRATPHRKLSDLIARIPDGKTIVFVRYGKGHNSYNSLIDNEPNLAEARVWRVYDLGERNARLTAQFPHRAAYLYDESAGVLTRYPIEVP